MFDKRPVAIPMLITCNTRVKTGRVKVNGNNCTDSYCCLCTGSNRNQYTIISLTSGYTFTQKVYLIHWFLTKVSR